MKDKPLDLEQHEEETAWDVWKRRIMFILMIGACVAFAGLPIYGGCSGAFGGGHTVRGTFRVAGSERSVTEGEFEGIRKRLLETYAVLSNRAPELSEQAVWEHILRDAAAEAEGVQVPDEEITKQLAQVP